MDPSPLESTNPIDMLIEVMERLRNPNDGCPWDQEQTFATIAPYTIEEAYEVADAIERGNMNELKEELGDLFLQIVFHSQIAKEAGLFDVQEVARSIVEKMIRRHPHVFAKSTERSSEEQTRAWEEIKATERKLKSDSETTASAMDGVALALPALLRAEKLQKRAARVGFDWKHPEPIFSKLDEEVHEIKDAISSGTQDDIEEEVGDLLFVCANLARKLKIDPEVALRKANAKFERRFKAMEKMSSERGSVFENLDLPDQEALWVDVKLNEH